MFERDVLGWILSGPRSLYVEKIDILSYSSWELSCDFPSGLSGDTMFQSVCGKNTCRRHVLVELESWLCSVFQACDREDVPQSQIHIYAADPPIRGSREHCIQLTPGNNRQRVSLQPRCFVRVDSCRASIALELRWLIGDKLRKEVKDTFSFEKVFYFIYLFCFGGGT